MKSEKVVDCGIRITETGDHTKCKNLKKRIFFKGHDLNFKKVTVVKRIRHECASFDDGNKRYAANSKEVVVFSLVVNEKTKNTHLTIVAKFLQ